MLVFTPAHLEAVVATFNTWVAEGGQNPKTAFFVAIGQPPPAFVPMIVVMVFYDGTEEEGRAIFKPFFDLNPVADLTVSRPYVEQVPLIFSTWLTLEFNFE